MGDGKKSLGGEWGRVEGIKKNQTQEKIEEKLMEIEGREKKRKNELVNDSCVLLSAVRAGIGGCLRR